MSRTTIPLAELRTALRSAVVCDALDALGVRDGALARRLAPLAPGTRLVGRALPVATVVVDGPPQVPYAGLLAALDALGPDDVYVISARGRADVSLWGELLTTAARAAGAAGAVCDGTVRDSEQVRAAGFPCFAYGTAPYDIHGRLEVTGHGVAIPFGTSTVRPGELVVGDDDGVVVVPAAVEAEVVEHALAKLRDESGFRTAVARGEPPSAAFARYRVL